jgi:hypothetical protein
MTYASTTKSRRERDLERDLDDARRQLDDNRRQCEIDRNAAAEASKERRRAMNPSNRLYNGEITDPREAIRMHIGLLQHEQTYEANLDRELAADGDTPFTIITPGQWEEWIDGAQALLREYDEVVGKAVSDLAAKWKAGPDGSTMQVCGEALIDGDWSRLAI